MSTLADDDRLRAYLLGQLQETDRAAIEEALFTDPAAHEQLSALEDDLVDAHLRGALRGEDRAAFAARLRTDATLRRKLALQRALVQEAARASATARTGWRRWLPLPVAAAALAAAAVLIVVDRPAEDAFRSKGGAEAQLRPRCPGGCRLGGLLGFEVVPPAGRPHFAAFGRRPDGRVVWYEPAEMGTASSTAAPGLWPRSFELDAAHVPGPHEIFGVFTAEGRTRAELAEVLGDELEGSDDVVVVRRTIEIEGAR